jgi:hypothetical protein
MRLSMTQAIGIRPDGSWTGQALIKLEEMAANKSTQATIAAAFDIPKREFEAILAKNKGRNEVRLAWERGRARVEQLFHDALVASALGTVTEEDIQEPVLDADGKPTGETRLVHVRTINTSKMSGTERIFYLKAQFGWKEGDPPEAKVSNVTLMLPKPRSRAEHFAMMGQADPRTLAAGPTAMKDVTPTVPALPAPSKETQR